MNYKLIFNTLGWVLICLGALMLFPAVCALIYGEETLFSFLSAIAISLFIGCLLTAKPPKSKTMYSKEGYIIVALSWILISLIGAIPFVVSNSIPNFVDAVFETASGFTTTGASILKDVEVLPKSIIFWRSFTHWIGGMGVLVFLVAFLPLSGSTNLYLIKAESPGPSVSKLVPKVRSTAKILYYIYIVLTAVQVILLLLGGLNLFDSLTLTFGTAGTGGFSIKNSGLANYSSYTQIVITIFMILFGIDFSCYYLLILGKFKDAFRSNEVRGYLLIILSAITLICINCYRLFDNMFEAIKHVSFQVASLITTTGYATVDFDLWPEFSKTVLILVMFIGACAGSTGGGIKVSRIIILLKSIAKEIKIAAHPNSVHKTTMNGRTIEHDTLRAINVFMVAYLAVFTASLLIISIDNFDFTTNFTAVLATLNNIGPGLAKVGPSQNFSLYSNFSTVILTLDMLIGRLEIFPVLVLLSPYTWKK